MLVSAVAILKNGPGERLQAGLRDERWMGDLYIWDCGCRGWELDAWIYSGICIKLLSPSRRAHGHRMGMLLEGRTNTLVLFPVACLGKVG